MQNSAPKSKKCSKGAQRNRERPTEFSLALVNSQKRTGVLVERTHLSRHGRRALIKFFLQRNDAHFAELIFIYKKPLQRKDVEIAGTDLQGV